VLLKIEGKFGRYFDYFFPARPTRYCAFHLSCERGNLRGNLGEDFMPAKESQNTSRRRKNEQ
jgi:hypothetical protein